MCYLIAFKPCLFLRVLSFEFFGIFVQRLIKFIDFLFDCHESILEWELWSKVMFDTVENFLARKSELGKVDFDLIEFLLNLSHFIHVHLIFLTHPFDF